MATRKLSWSKRQPVAGESVSSRLAAGGWFGCCPICFLATGANVRGLPATALGFGGSLMTIGPEVRTGTLLKNPGPSPRAVQTSPVSRIMYNHKVTHTAAASPTGASSISLEATSSSSTESDGRPRGTKIKTSATGAK